MSKDKKAVLERIRKRTTPEQREFVQMNLSIARQIIALLKKKGLTQKEFAKLLGKNESEISRLLSGMHNFSLKSLAKVSAVLEEEIITTPMEACVRYKSIQYIMLDSYARSNKNPGIEYPEKKNIKVIYRKQSTLKAS